MDAVSEDAPFKRWLTETAQHAVRVGKPDNEPRFLALSMLPLDYNMVVEEAAPYAVSADTQTAAAGLLYYLSQYTDKIEVSRFFQDFSPQRSNSESTSFRELYLAKLSKRLASIRRPLVE